jgi:hypothetical protein
MDTEGTSEATKSPAVDTGAGAASMGMETKGPETAGAEGAEPPLPPFLTNEPMEGDPQCQWEHFLSPQLRRFPRSYTTIRLR